jgi:Methyltransferase domain
MSASEKVGLIFLLEQLRPKVAIEIGTKNGGSLQALARFSEQVYSIDVDPEIPTRLAGKFSNVEYLIGPSDEVLPPLIERIQQEKAELSFALVDGDHSAEGVRKDIDNLLKFRPTVPFYIVMHDSFNPQCRLGLTLANWPANPHVHAVELDFVAGGVNSAPAFRDELWGGLALGILLPEERQSRFEITRRSERTRKAVMMSPRPLVKHMRGEMKRTLPGRAAGKAKRMILGLVLRLRRGSHPR